MVTALAAYGQALFRHPADIESIVCTNIVTGREVRVARMVEK